MKTFFSNLIAVFRHYWPWHLLFILLTAILVGSGFDAWWYAYWHNTWFYNALWPAVILGGLLPIIIPAILLALGAIERWRYRRPGGRLLHLGWALAQAAILGTLISGTYKALTGRAHPSLDSLLNPDQLLSLSQQFNFGFWRGGVFWGWPSTHTTIAFAMAVTFALLVRQYKPWGKHLFWLAIIYAWYIGIGVSVSIHWFSDFVAGAILGTVIGLVVGHQSRWLKT